MVGAYAAQPESQAKRVICIYGTPQSVRDASYDAYAQMNLLGRVGHAEEAAHTVLYLMSNGYTTGSTLFPDGGYILR